MTTAGVLRPQGQSFNKCSEMQSDRMGLNGYHPWLEDTSALLQKAIRCKLFRDLKRLLTGITQLLLSLESIRSLYPKPLKLSFKGVNYYGEGLVRGVEMDWSKFKGLEIKERLHSWCPSLAWGPHSPRPGTLCMSHL